MAQLRRGVLIAVEGIDGSGKSTLANGIHRLFSEKNYTVVLTKEPGGTPLGIKLRSILQNQDTLLDPKTEYLLFAADRAQHVSQIIMPNLQANKLILSDRMADSSLAYQGYGRGLDRAMISTINQWAMQGIKPDLVLYVKVPISVALERIAQRRTLTTFEQHTEFMQQVAQGFDTMYQDRPDVIILDGTQQPETVINQAISQVEQWLEQQQLLQ